MSRSNIFEIIMGFIVLIGAITIAVFAFNKSSVKNKLTGNCYIVYALFGSVDGLNVGDDIKISGIKVGNVTSLSLNLSDFTPKVEMCINKNIKIPADSSASITNSNLLERKYISIMPGSDKNYIGNNGLIENTNSDINISSMITKIINSVIK